MSWLTGFASSITPQINATPASFSTGGVSANFSGNRYNLSESPTLSGAVGNLSATFGSAANTFAGLRSTVAPGFSDFRKAGLAQLNTQQQSTTANLKDNLARRRIFGSSFGQDALARSDAEFAEKKAQFEAQSYLQEIEASNRLIQEEFQARTQQFSSVIGQMNFETGVAAKLTGDATNAMTQAAIAQAKLDQETLTGIGTFAGKALGAGIGAFAALA